MTKTKPQPGLQGDYRDTCVVCLGPTDTGLAFYGDSNWAIAGLMALGIPDDEATATLAVTITEVGPVVGQFAWFVRVCTECADSAGLRVALMVGPVPGYAQKEEAK